MDASQTESPVIAPQLGLWDAVSLIVGIIVGVGIFETPASIFRSVPGPGEAALVWVVGGLLALVGALCFAELSSTYPRSGGEYVYLTRAFGPLVGYLFAWAQLAVIRPGSIAAVAYVFALYAADLFALNATGIFFLAGLSVVVLTGINVLGVVLGANTQNLLTIAKVVGLAAMLGVGLVWGHVERVEEMPATAVPEGWFAVAMIYVLWTYAGWHEAAYVAAEVKDARRNIPLSLLLGTALVTVIYLLVNAAYVLGLGFAGARSEQLAANLMRLAWPEHGGEVMALIVVVAALGSMNGMIFTTARIYSVFGADHRLFAPLSRWSRRLGTPARALVVQGVVSLAFIGGVWSLGGERESFDKTINLTAAVFWCFFLLTGIALFVLRHTDADRPRPFPVPWYPVLPLLFCGCCTYMVIGAVLHLPRESLVGLMLVLAGLPFYFVRQKIKRRHETETMETVPK